MRALFNALGYQETRGSIGDVTVVANWKGFLVAAVQSEDVSTSVRALARQLSQYPGRVLAVCLHPRKRLAVAAPRLGASGVTPVLLVDLVKPAPESLDVLRRFRPTQSTGLAHAVQIDNLLHSEVAGDRFYTAFRALHRDWYERLDGGSRDERHLAALLPLLRVLFLYFVQAKGWLDGRPTFLRDELDRALQQRRSFHRDILDQLCFETLNRPRSSRPHREFGEIPYLNGGLFERHPVERAARRAHRSNRWWRDAFDDVFERFRFCLRESEQVGAIAPDMLGRVFERLMLTDERHTSGTYYTPHVIVRQIVEATIETALVGTATIPERVVTQLFSEGRVDPDWRPRVRRALDALRVLDPAVGSGAFLLEVLSTLTRLHAAAGARPKALDVLKRRKRILHVNVFGVDKNAVAVRLAELRLWLAVIADDPTQDIAAVESLPNLDGVIRQGDSLLDPIAATRAHGTHPSRLPTDQTRAIARTRQALFRARGPDYYRQLAALRKAELALSHSLLEQADLDLTAQIADLDTAAASPTLFGERSGLKPAQRRRRRQLIHQRAVVAGERDRSRHGTHFFSFESHVPEVVNAGGFSAVVGNPPWVRSERLAPRLRKMLKERFRWWQTDARPGFNPLPDLSIAFLERALELTRNGGAVGVLMPSKLGTASYAERVRGALVRETSVRYIHRVPPKQANLFGATTYPVALVLHNTPPTRKTIVHLDFDRQEGLAQRQLQASGPWLLVPGHTRQALQDLRQSAPHLDTLGSVQLGVKTGANTCFVGTARAHRGQMLVTTGVGAVPVPPHLVRPALRGRDVGAFGAECRRVILWPFSTDNTPFSESALPPALRTFFRSQREQLTTRSDYRTGAYWIPFRLGASQGNRRVVWPDISRAPRAVSLDHIDRSSAVPLNTCYVFTAAREEDALVVTGVFNSIWARALVCATADEARGGYRRVNARVAATLPIPSDSKATSALAALSREAHQTPRVSNHDLDDAVADALGLSARVRTALRTFVHDHG